MESTLSHLGHGLSAFRLKSRDAGVELGQPAVDDAQLLPQVRVGALWLSPAYAGTGTGDELDKACLGEDLRGLTRGGPAHAVRLRELAFRRQPRTDLQVAGFNLRGELVGELLRLDGRTCHLVLDGPFKQCLWSHYGSIVVASSWCRPVNPKQVIRTPRL